MRFWGVIRLRCLKMKEIKKKRNFIMKKNQENQKQNKKKYLRRRKKKLDLPGKKTLKIQKLMINGPTILEFLLVITLVESWSSRKVFDQNHPLDCCSTCNEEVPTWRLKVNPRCLLASEAGPSQRKKIEKRQKLK